MDLPFELIQEIWRWLAFEDKRAFEKALRITSKHFRFEKLGVLKKFSLTWKPPPLPVFHPNVFGGYLIFTIPITKTKYIEMLQTSFHNITIIVYEDGCFPLVQNV